MDDAPYTPTAIVFTVRPRVAPTVAITAASERVSQGTPVTATATADDNVRVNRVEFSHRRSAGGRR